MIRKILFCFLFMLCRLSLPAAPTGNIDVSDDGTTVTITGSVSQALAVADYSGAADDKPLCEIKDDKSVSYYAFKDISAACSVSNLAELMKSADLDLTETAAGAAWKKVKTVVVNGASKLSCADLCVLNYMGNVDRTACGNTAKSENERKNTGGTLTTLELDDDVLFVVEDTKIVLITRSTQDEDKVSYLFYYSNMLYAYGAEPRNLAETDLRGGAIWGTTIENLRLPKSLTSILSCGICANQIKSLDLRDYDNLTILGMTALGNNSELTTVVLPKKLKTIYGGLLSNCVSLEEAYIITDEPITDEGGYDLFGSPKAQLFVRLSHYKHYLTTEKGLKSCESQLYPMIEKGKMWRTFSFDKALDFSSVKGFYDNGNSLSAYIVPSYDMADKAATCISAGEYTAETGVLIYGGGEAGELYPIKRPANPASPVNYLVAAVQGKMGIRQKDDGNINFLLSDGVFHICDAAGGRVAEYRAYLSLPLGSVLSAKEIHFTFGDITPVDAVRAGMNPESDAVYTMLGVRVDGRKAIGKGVYVKNGKKYILK